MTIKPSLTFTLICCARWELRNTQLSPTAPSCEEFQLGQRARSRSKLIAFRLRHTQSRLGGTTSGKTKSAAEFRRCSRRTCVSRWSAIPAWTKHVEFLLSHRSHEWDSITTTAALS